tara:strand:+ start:245 stop:628 length:384 start_codon:yes stop_codon:yes gene_type:complete
MTSQLKVDKLQGRTTAGSIVVTSEGTSVETNLQQGLCKAWCRMEMSTPAYNDSFNLGTITDNGTGDMTFAITNAFSGATFACTSGDGNDNALDEGITTTTARQVSRDNSGTKGDSSRASFVAHGDLA